MLITLFVIGLIILIFGLICWSRKSYRDGTPKFFYWVYHNEWFYCTLNAVGGLLAGLALIVTMFVAPIYSNVMVIDDKIALYEEENASIEQDIGALVKSYKDYESETLENFKLDNPSIIFSMYPELKSNELATKQIELYISNNRQIKQLKEEKLEYKVLKWWLFF